MQTIGKFDLWSFLDGSNKAQRTGNTAVRQSPGHRVTSYIDLATKIAELQFRNRDCVLLFRGQGRDHLNQEDNTSLRPGLFRPEPGEARPPRSGVLINRFEELRRAEEELARLFLREKLFGRTRLQRQRVLRWSILQHYEVCPTPLLDVTHSLRIAASFASLQADGEAFVYVLGLPNLSGAVTASAEAGLQAVRLASMCPPSAIRPHIQEGYLLGEYPEMADFDQKQFYQSYEIDFGRRLVAKFRFNPRTFWKDTSFPMVSKPALYPNADDALYRFTRKVKAAVNPDP